jgi:SAM-dependent methyltransferase
MKRYSLTKAETNEFPRPTALVRKFAPNLAATAGAFPILDVGCGSGRNALPLSELGCTVICMDKDLSPLEAEKSRLQGFCSLSTLARLIPQKIDLLRSEWPIAPRFAGGIVNIHFFLPSLFPFFATSLVPGGYLLFETVPGCGENYLELPKAGQIKALLGEPFRFDLYKEKKVGPINYDAVTVRLVARQIGGN